MKLKKLHLALMAAGTVVCNIASAQLFIDQATFTIQSGATVTVQGDVTSNVDIQGAGKVILKGTANQNVNMNGFSIPSLEIDNTANITLTGSAKVAGDVLFTNGKVLLGSNNISLAAAGTVTNATNAKYFVTNGTGRVIKAAVGAVAFTFPIGNSITTYNPLTVANTGTADSIGARASATVLSGGATGTAYSKEVVNNTWTITEAVAGGSNLALTAGWSATDELAGFDRTRTGISTYLTTPAASVGWDLLNSQTAAASGAGPYTVARSGFTGVGTFAVGTRPVLSPLLVSPKVFLQGNYNTGTGVMGDALRLANLIPTTEPYSSATGGTLITAALKGSGGGETAASSVIGAAAGASTNNTIVDWVLVQLHRSSDGVVVSQRAALLQRDGDVVDTDGTSPVNLAGNALGSYYVSVRHRNHLGARTAATLSLAKVSTTGYDFTTGLGQAFAGAVTNNAMATLTASVFGLWGGNSNTDIFSRKTGSASTNDYSLFLAAVSSVAAPGPTAVYRREDFNLDGNVRKTGSATTNDYSKFLSMLGSATIITQPAF
ncbi:MAG: hypothetical protein V4685_11555 [Bacteroidota bacterium]